MPPPTQRATQRSAATRIRLPTKMHGKKKVCGNSPSGRMKMMKKTEQINRENKTRTNRTRNKSANENALIVENNART